MVLVLTGHVAVVVLAKCERDRLFLVPVRLVVEHVLMTLVEGD